MFCPQCGSQTVDDARFCPSCGASFAPPVESVIPDPPVAPEPVVPEPAPPAPEPAPVYAEPAPVYAAPAPVYAESAPVYAAPAPVWTGWSKAPLFPRLVASLIDSIIMQPLVVPAVFWIMADAAREQPPVGGAVLMAVGGLWMVVYSYIKDGLKGASFGKRLAGLLVVDLRDNRPSGIGQSALRALVLSFLGGIEAIIVLVDAKGQRLGDKLAKTQVVRASEYEAAVPGWIRPGKGLAIVLLVITLLLGSVGGIAGGLVWARAMSGDGSGFTDPGTGTVTAPVAGEPTADADVDDAAQIVTAFYAAINAADMDAIRAAVDDEIGAQVDPGAFEGWSETAFEFTRGWVDAGTAYIVGRESVQAYGSGGDGGVQFTLVDSGSGWRITGWQAVDATQVQGSDTTGSSTGIAGPLSDATARDAVTQILKARQIGAANTIRTLATERFLTDNSYAWLDGIDNSEFFTAFKITKVTLSGSKATVTVSETWVDGVQTARYGLVESGGSVLVDSWDAQ